MDQEERSTNDESIEIEVVDVTLPASQSTSSDEILSTSNSKDPLTEPNPDVTTASYNSVSFMRSPSPNNLNSSRGNVRRWSQSLSKGAKGRKSIRQRTIHCMPSRQQKPRPFDSQVLSAIADETEIDQLVQEIEQYDHLMEDSAFGEQLRIGTLRSLPQSITIKRQIKTKLIKTVADKSRERGDMNRWKQFKYQSGVSCNRSKSFIRNAVINVELWYASMKEIEGHFGGGVGTYFKFLRYLFIVNLFLMVFSFSFVVLPQLIFNATLQPLDETDSSDGILASQDQLIPTARESSDDFQLMDLITAEGCLENSILFYGSYTNQTFHMTSQRNYNLPFAYFLTMVCLYATTFIVVSSSMARSYRTSFIETSGGRPMFAHKIFCSLDFSISNRKAAEVKKKSILRDLQTSLDEMYDSDDDRTRLQRFWSVSTQISAHVLVLAILVGLGYSIWTLLQMTATDSETGLCPFYVPVIALITMILLQTFFAWLANMEAYKSPRTTLHITLLRNYCLDIVIIGALLVYWLFRSRKEKCWGTSIGQEIYRLIIVDFILVGIGGSTVNAIRFLIHKHLWEGIGLPEFNISRSSLSLIFNQTLLLIGLFFSPFLATIAVFKLILTFYLKKAVLINFCRPPSKLWRSAQTSTLFLVITFLSLVGVVVALVYVITQVPVSATCGPFRDHKFIFHILMGDPKKPKLTHWTLKLLMILFRPAAIGGILLTMCVLVYYLRSKSRARIAMVKLLKDMLYLEAKDKEFLLANITRVTQGRDWIFDDLLFRNGATRDRSQRCVDSNGAESSSTWNYRRNAIAGGDRMKHDSESSIVSSMMSSSDATTVNEATGLRNRKLSISP